MPNEALPAITTPRLDLVAITPGALRSEQAADGTLTEILNCRVPSNWPHENWEPHVYELLLSTFASYSDEVGWHRYIILRSDEQGEPVLIGTTGAFRWPGDRSSAEIGYGLVSEFQHRGFALEAAPAMLSWIEATGAVTRVIAHTYPELTSSIRILERCGFTLEGPGAEPRTLRYAKQPATP